MSRVCGVLGAGKRGGNLLFGSLPVFSFFVEWVVGFESAAFTLGGGALPVGFHSRCVSRPLFARGVGACAYWSRLRV